MSPTPFSLLLLTPPSSLGSLFGLQWNFDVRPLLCYRELNMPCPDLLSAATFIPLASKAALKSSENAVFSENTSFRCCLLGLISCFPALFSVSVVFTFMSLLWLWPRSRGKSNYCWPPGFSYLRFLFLFFFPQRLCFLCLSRCEEVKDAAMFIKHYFISIVWSCFCRFVDWWWMWAFQCQFSVGHSHLVLVGWVKLVPGLWVVLLVPEAANFERFRACRIKREGKKRPMSWGRERRIGGKQQQRWRKQKRHRDVSK